MTRGQLSHPGAKFAVEGILPGGQYSKLQLDLGFERRVDPSELKIPEIHAGPFQKATEQIVHDVVWAIEMQRFELSQRGA